MDLTEALAQKLHDIDAAADILVLEHPDEMARLLRAMFHDITNDIRALLKEETYGA